jgi:hypothetical protein
MRNIQLYVSDFFQLPTKIFKSIIGINHGIDQNHNVKRGPPPIAKRILEAIRSIRQLCQSILQGIEVLVWRQSTTLPCTHNGTAVVLRDARWQLTHPTQGFSCAADVAAPHPAHALLMWLHPTPPMRCWCGCTLFFITAALTSRRRPDVIAAAGGHAATSDVMVPVFTETLLAQMMIEAAIVIVNTF